MKSIKKLFKTPVALGALAAVTLAFAGCNNAIEGTQLNYGEKEQEVIGTTGAKQTPKSAAITIDTVEGSQSFAKADKKSMITVEFNNITGNGIKVDVESAKKSVKVYKLKTNTDDSTYYPMHDGELTPVFVADIGDSNGVDLTLAFDVDTTSMITNTFAVIVDATVLKDIKGNFILNSDGNYKAGQESDSVIQYIGVGKKADGTTLDSVSKITFETFNRYCSPINYFSIPNAIPDDEKATWTIELPATDLAGPDDTSAVYDKALTSKLNEGFILRVKEPEAVNYTEVKLTWAWKDALENASLAAGSDIPGYTATTSAIKPGTQLEAVLTTMEWTAPDWYKKVYGHPAQIYYWDIVNNEAVLSEPGTKISMGSWSSNIFAKDAEPDYIVKSFSSTSKTWAESVITADAIANAQKSFLKTTGYNSTYKRFEVTIAPNSSLAEEDKLEFASLDNLDFIVVDVIGTDKNGDNDYWNDGNPVRKIDAKISVVKNGKGKFDKVVVELANKNYNTTYLTETSTKPVTLKLFVGNGTSLKKNPGYSKQLKFGMYKDASKGVVSGYVPLN